MRAAVKYVVLAWRAVVGGLVGVKVETVVAAAEEMVTVEDGVEIDSGTVVAFVGTASAAFVASSFAAGIVDCAFEVAVGTRSPAVGSSSGFATAGWGIKVVAAVGRIDEVAVVVKWAIAVVHVVG